MSEHKIKVAVTCGDPNGVGMETIIKVFSDPRMLDSLTPVIYAHPEVVKVYRKTLHTDEFQYNTINSAGEAVHKK
jgi:4-hydroxythreonine-4-phosphate dehydrogenase